MTMTMMRRWTWVSSWLKMMTTLRSMGQRMFHQKKKKVDEELVPASDEDGGEIFDTDSEGDA
jgi:hypothetical protein